MKKLHYQAPELQGDGSLETHEYFAEGDEEHGWQILRDGKPYLKLGPGYVPVRVRYCGVCSTDLARQFLPYPLPQIIGHEVVAKKDGTYYAVEINASERARGIESEKNPYSHDSMHTQDPRRITLGINRLPGGFAPELLAPLQALVPVPANLSPKLASLTEPFAATLQAVEATAPRDRERIAVLGPRRLGSLLIAALDGYRKQKGLRFTITALARHKHILDVTCRLGADQTLNLSRYPSQAQAAEDLKESFDVVFDTTGSPQGFELALALARRAVHLKSTNGQEVLGLTHLTDLVVDELSLLPYGKKALDFTWPIEEEAEFEKTGKAGYRRKNPNVFASPSVSKAIIKEIESAGHKVYQAGIAACAKEMFREGPLVPVEKLPDFLQGSPFPRFDLAVASSLAEVDEILRPVAPEEWGLVRARGAILLTEPCRPENLLTEALCKRGLELHTSRCGSFERALGILSSHPEIAEALEKLLITQVYPLDKLEEAFATARDSSKSLKVVVECSQV